MPRILRHIVVTCSDGDRYMCELFFGTRRMGWCPDTDLAGAQKWVWDQITANIDETMDLTYRVGEVAQLAGVK